MRIGAAHRAAILREGDSPEIRVPCTRPARRPGGCFIGAESSVLSSGGSSLVFASAPGAKSTMMLAVAPYCEQNPAPLHLTGLQMRKSVEVLVPRSSQRKMTSTGLPYPPGVPSRKENPSQLPRSGRPCVTISSRHVGNSRAWYGDIFSRTETTPGPLKVSGEEVHSWSVLARGCQLRFSARTTSARATPRLTRASLGQPPRP